MSITYDRDTKPPPPSPPHVPPPAGGEWDDYDPRSMALPGAFAVALLPTKCAGCHGRHDTIDVAYATKHPIYDWSDFHKIAGLCDDCRMNLLWHSGVEPLDHLVAHGGLPARPRFALGNLFGALATVRNPRIGYEGIWPFLRRHLAGDFGEVGRLDRIEVSDRDRRAGPLAPVPVANRVAIESGVGLVRSSYRLGYPVFEFIHVTTKLGDRGLTIVGPRPA